MKYCKTSSADRSIYHFTSNSKIMRQETVSAWWISVFSTPFLVSRISFPALSHEDTACDTPGGVQAIWMLMLLSPEYLYSTPAWVDQVKPQNSQCNNKGTYKSFTWHLPSSQFCWDHHPALCNSLKGLGDPFGKSRCNENSKNINGTFIRLHLLLTTENTNHHSQVFQSQSNFSLFHLKI